MGCPGLHLSSPSAVEYVRRYQMRAVLEIPFPPRPPERAGSRLEPPFVAVEPRWEYLQIVREAPELLSEQELNALGEERWELTGVAPAGGRVHFYFKRERHS
jgi:hypothetical protein